MMHNDNHICINAFSHLTQTAEGLPIFFCKTDWLHYDFEAIQNFNKPCVIVCGNSDYCVGDHYHPAGIFLADSLPTNVQAVFCQNNLVYEGHPKSSKFHILPLGIENYIQCGRKNCGSIPPNAIEKYSILCNIDTTVVPCNFLYANFTLRQNCQSIHHRQKIKELSQTCSHIRWEEPALTTEQYYDRILNHEATICAQGNGPGDNHRIYEVLYLNRIPITFNREMYDRIHKNFPVVFLEQAEMLTDKMYVLSLVERAKNMKWNREMLYAPYWMDVISKTANSKGML